MGMGVHLTGVHLMGVHLMLNSSVAQQRHTSVVQLKLE
jgi:hypothetical protein